MDTLRALDHLSNVLTVDEWREFVRTDDYLWMMARVRSYHCSEMDELIKKGKMRRAEAWKIAFDIATSVVADDDLPDGQVGAAVTALAEKLMVEQDLIPPTYTKWSDCLECGRVPVSEDSEDALSICPWCAK